MNEQECPPARAEEPACSEAAGAPPHSKCLHGTACPEAKGMLGVAKSRCLACRRGSVAAWMREWGFQEL